MAARKDEAAGLAEKLVQQLEVRRGLGGDSYPLALRRLAELADPQTPPALLDKAVSRKAFTARAVIACKKDADSPVALLDDLDLLAANPLLMEFLLGSVSSPDRWSWPIARLAARLNTRLKKPFQDAVGRLIGEDRLPATVGVVVVRGKPHLFLRRFQPPKPPAEELAEQLVHQLHVLRRENDGRYPPTLTELAQVVGAADVALLQQAVAEKTFKAAIVLSSAGKAGAPVALAADRERLAGSPRLLEFLLVAARTPETQAFPVAGLKKPLARNLAPLFQDAVSRLVRDGSLPPSVGWIAIKNTPHLFLLSDVQGGRPASAPALALADRKPVSPAAQDPGRTFDDFFDRLDRQEGSHNFISLVELRRALPWDRSIFDAELNRLRRAGYYTLSAAEGRHGVSPAEQEAAIHEEGAMLLFVSRRER